MEKKFTFNNATLVWWFISWRTGLVVFILEVLVVLVQKVLVQGSILSEFLGWLAIIVAILTQVFFIKTAVNRNYESKSNGSFRLTVLEPSQSAPVSGFSSSN